MKKLLLAMLAGMMALGAVAQGGGKFTVKGTFVELGDTVQFYFPEYDKGEIRAITGEMLEATADLKDATMLEILKWTGEGKWPYKVYLTYPAIPGETLVVTSGDKGEIQLGGSQFYVDYNEAMNAVEPANRAVEEFIKHLRDELHNGVPEAQVMDEYQEKLPPLIQDYTDALMDYIKAHPDQDAAAALITELPENDPEQIEAVAALLTERARGSVAANLYKRNLEEAKKQAEEEAKQYALEGSAAPDFTLNDINGKPLALSSLRGKWVVIDFWGSWCGWCIKGIPKMKEYYAKYQGKLEILGVDCNDTVEKWKGAVAQHQLPWLHVYWDKEGGDNPLELYGVQGFPTKVVVNPQGQVARIIVGEDPAFYDYLDEVLK